MAAYYRDYHGLYACSAILFNHESPLRDERYVTQKIVLGLLRLKSQSGPPLTLRSLDVQRDWGSAQEYVQAMWKMLQQQKADDFLLATGVATPVRNFVEMCAQELGFQLAWRVLGSQEEGYDQKTGQLLLQVPTSAQPQQVQAVRLGDACKAARLLDWKARTQVKDLVEWMVREASGS